jgi:speckle-type POZ protein
VRNRRGAAERWSEREIEIIRFAMSSRAGGGKPLWSASTIVAKVASGYHILRIDGYSRTMETPTGESIASLPFSVGGRCWRIRYYPNGDKLENKEYISLYLYLHDRSVEAEKAQLMFRFVGDVAEQPLILGGLHTFEKQGWGYGKFIKRKDLEESKHLVDDSFSIRCDVAVRFNDVRVEKAPEAAAAAAMISVQPSDLHQHLGSLLLTQKGADVVFDVAGETFAAHRCVLAARSPVFTAELFGAMKEGHTGGVVRIEDMEPRAFKALLYFLYTDLLFPKTMATTMNQAEDGDVGGDDEDVLCQHLLVAADKYNLERLKSLCEKKLSECIHVGTVAIILTLAEQHRCPGLKKVCLHFLRSPANLRAVASSDAFKHLSSSCPSVMVELVAMLGNSA